MISIKIVLAGGGTAGHVTPNIALIPALKKAGFTDISYIGTKGIEKELITKEGIPFHEIQAGKLRRYIDMENIKDIFRIIKGTRQAKKLLKQLKPDVVFSKGGFASCPVVWSAKKLKIPVVAHESDITPGLANKLSLPSASKICYAFPETKAHLPQDKAVYTGIPIRPAFFKGDKQKGLSFLGFSGEKPLLTIIGGSQGSKFLNDTVRGNLDTLLNTFDICHLCGKDNTNASLLNREGYKQFEYVHGELADIMQATDLFVSRAGATTLFEILAMQKPAVLIPLSKGSRGDQILNANSFEKQGYTKKLDEETMTEQSFLDTVLEVYRDKEKYQKAMASAKDLNSAEKIISILKETIKK